MYLVPQLWPNSLMCIVSMTRTTLYKNMTGTHWLRVSPCNKKNGLMALMSMYKTLMYIHQLVNVKFTLFCTCTTMKYKFTKFTKSFFINSSIDASINTSQCMWLINMHIVIYSFTWSVFKGYFQPNFTLLFSH